MSAFFAIMDCFSVSLLCFGSGSSHVFWSSSGSKVIDFYPPELKKSSLVKHYVFFRPFCTVWFRSYEETEYIFIFHTIEMPVDCMCPSNTPFTKKLKIVFWGVAPFFGFQKQARAINYLM
jgi:hypothetical protein